MRARWPVVRTWPDGIRRSTMTGSRALVLGGGALTGVGWLIGVIAGLAEAGVDLCSADLIVGTSSGSVVGAQLASGADPQRLYDRLFTSSVTHPARELSVRALTTLATILGDTDDPPRARREVVDAAGRTPPPASENELLSGVRDWISAGSWPHRRLLLSAVDADTGEFVALDRHSGMSLCDAIAASCALPFVYPPFNADGRRWVDGFIRSPANADLAAGHDRIVVLAPMVQGFVPGADVPDQIARLEATSSTRVAVITGVEFDATMRARGLDPDYVAPMAELGRKRVVTEFESIARVWSAK